MIHVGASDDKHLRPALWLVWVVFSLTARCQRQPAVMESKVSLFTIRYGSQVHLLRCSSWAHDMTKWHACLQEIPLNGWSFMKSEAKVVLASSWKSALPSISAWPGTQSSVSFLHLPRAEAVPDLNTECPQCPPTSFQRFSHWSWVFKMSSTKEDHSSTLWPMYNSWQAFPPQICNHQPISHHTSLCFDKDIQGQEPKSNFKKMLTGCTSRRHLLKVC